MDSKTAWECDCGTMEFSELPPSECSKCWKENSFVEVPKDMVDEIEEENLIETIRPKDLENGDVLDEEEDEE